jgi:hypothetical protein
MRWLITLTGSREDVDRLPAKRFRSYRGEEVRLLRGPDRLERNDPPDANGVGASLS